LPPNSTSAHQAAAGKCRGSWPASWFLVAETSTASASRSRSRSRSMHRLSECMRFMFCFLLF
jgi:hypothetical protein